MRCTCTITGNDRIQLKLLAGYASNIPLYQYLHAYLHDSRVPLLAVWGRNDEIFGPDGGHFLLESDLDNAAALIRGFLGRTLV
jgi:hypothetical protein